MKKWIPRALGLTAALALVLTAVWLAAGLQPAAPPQPEVQPASRTLITEGELLYDGAALTASDVSLADGAAAPQPADTPQEDAPAEDAPADTADGLEDFQDITDRGGGSGGQLPSRETDSRTDGDGGGQTEEGDAWFTTSIVDGDRVTDAAYPFTIRHLKPEAQVLGLSVSVNGGVTDYAANTSGGTLTLTGGSVDVQAPRITNESEAITCGKAELVLTFDEEIVGTAALTMEAAEIPGSYTADISGISFNIPAMEDDQQLSIRLDVTLSNGQFLTAPGGTFSFLNGEMVSSVG